MFLLLSIKPNMFQVCCQRTDLKRQTSLVSSKNVIKATKLSDFSDVIYITIKSELVGELVNEVVKQKH